MTSTPPAEPETNSPSRSSWRSFVAGGCLGMVLGVVVFMAAVLIAYNFVFEKSVRKMAEVQEKELRPVPLRAGYGIRLRGIDGTTLDMESLKGQPIFLHFWRPECVSCVAEIPGINALYKEFAGKGMAFVSVSLEPGDDLGASVGIHNVQFPVYTVEKTDLIPKVFRTATTPATYIVDAAGFIVYSHAGAVNWDTADAREYLKRLASVQN